MADRIERLVARALANDESAYTDLYRQLTYLLKGMCYRYRRPADDIVEYAHDVVVHVLLQLPRYQRRGDALPWILVVARHACLSRRRRMHVPLVSLSSCIRDGEGKTDEIEKFLADPRRPFQQLEAIIDLRRMGVDPETELPPEPRRKRRYPVVNKTGFQGVLYKSVNCYQARMSIKKKTVCLGSFNTAEAAHDVYKAAVAWRDAGGRTVR